MRSIAVRKPQFLIIFSYHENTMKIVTGHDVVDHNQNFLVILNIVWESEPGEKFMICVSITLNIHDSD